tara:strand:+ start:4313 stop:4789 length:477 start_codon:yes stop_codon:yes gene_type:complete
MAQLTGASCNVDLSYNSHSCKTCTNISELYGSNGIRTTIQLRKAFNQVGVPSSEYIMNKTALNVNQDFNKNICSVPQKSRIMNNLSDRFRLSISLANVPTRGNSTRSTITSLKPGATTPGGEGVDVKHGSYARYLALKKGKNLYSSPPYSGIITSNQC